MGKSRTFVLMAWLLLLTMAGCLKDDPNQGTIILMGTESYVKTIEEVIPDALLSFLDANDIALHEGNVPPDIQGELRFPRDLIYYNCSAGEAIQVDDTLFYRFGGDNALDGNFVYYPNGQHGRVLPCDSWETGVAISATNPAYLMGNGNDFTMYFIQHCKVEENDMQVKYDLDRAVVIVGTVTADGLDDAMVAYLNIGVSNIDNPMGFVPNQYIMAMVGRINVYQVKPDREAIWMEWYLDPYGN